MITTEERQILDLLKDAWDAFVKLPIQHQGDKPEFMRAIHAAQHIVLARPTLRDMDEVRKGETG